LKSPTEASHPPSTHALAGWKTASGVIPQRPGRTSAAASLRRDSDNTTITTAESFDDAKTVERSSFTALATTVPALPALPAMPPPAPAPASRRPIQYDSAAYGRHSYSHSQSEVFPRRSVDSIGNIRAGRPPSITVPQNTNSRYGPVSPPPPSAYPSSNANSNGSVTPKPPLSRKNSGASTGNKLARKPVPAYVPSPFGENTDPLGGDLGFAPSSTGSASTLSHVGSAFNGNGNGGGAGITPPRGGFKFAGEKEGPVHYLIPDPPPPPRN